MEVDDGCGEVDFLSQMPDDVLCTILSFLRIEDAIYAKLLSRRWRHLFPPNPTLCFDDNEFRGDGNTFRMRLELVDEPEKFVAWVDRVMRQLRVPTIEAFELNTVLGGEYARTVDEWIRIACLLKAERIYLEVYFLVRGLNINPRSPHRYTFPFHLLHASGSSNLKHLHLARCNLPSFSNLGATPIISLRTLCLDSVSFLPDSSLEAISCYFPNLETLDFSYCEPKMQNVCCLWGQLLNLKSFSVKCCGDTEDLEISKVKLTNFKYSGSVKTISFKGLNCLLDLDINLWPGAGRTFRDILSSLPKEAPQLKRLAIGCISWMDFGFPSSIPTFKCLKYLCLSIKSDVDAELGNLSTFLHVALLLQEMDIFFDSQHAKWSAEWLEERLKLVHLHKRIRRSNEEQNECSLNDVHSHLKKVGLLNVYLGRNDC